MSISRSASLLQSSLSGSSVTKSSKNGFSRRPLLIESKATQEKPSKTQPSRKSRPSVPFERKSKAGGAGVGPRVPPGGGASGSGARPSASPGGPKQKDEQRNTTLMALATGVASILAAVYLTQATGEGELLSQPLPDNVAVQSPAEMLMPQTLPGGESNVRRLSGRTYLVEVPEDRETIAGLAEPKAPEAAQSAKELFNPVLYQGRWYEVASMKLGFAGEGQRDCHCTTGVYRLMPGTKDKLRVSTFCVHGNPKGRISGIQGEVSCADPAGLRLLPEFMTPLERREGVVEKCVLKFPSLPFIPAETYDIIATDYKSFALVQGSPNQTFVQIYSRTPNPGPEFIAEKKRYLGSLGWNTNLIVDTPQDCAEMKMEGLMDLMEKAQVSQMDIGQDAQGNLVPLDQAGEATFKLSGIAINPIDPVETIKDIKNLIAASANAVKNG